MGHDPSETPVPEPQQVEDEPSLLCDEEDLFDFPPLDMAFEGGDPFLDLDPFAEPLDPSVSDQDLTDLEDGQSTVFDNDQPEASTADAFADPEEVTESSPEEEPAADTAAEIPAVAASQPRFQAVHAIIVLALIVNLSLVAVVWKTNSGLEQSLEGMRSDLTHSAQERELQQALLIAQASSNNQNSQDNAGYQASETSAATLARSTTSTTTAPETDPARLALRFARQEIVDGQPAFARRRLFRFLCEIDRLERDPALEAEARFLIAEAYTFEAGVSHASPFAKDR